jgi:site-specific DNA recombinase
MIVVDAESIGASTGRRGRKTERDRKEIQERSITARKTKHAESALGKKVRVAISERMSDEKDESMGFEAQNTLIRQLIKQRGFDINDPSIEFVVFRDLESAWKRNERPAFDRMMKEIEKGLFTDVFFYHTDRFTRNSDLSGLVVPILRDSGIRIHATNLPEAFDLKNFTHRQMWDMFVNMAEYEASRFHERQINSHMERKDGGFKRGGTAPVGMKEKVEYRDGWKTERHVFTPNEDTRSDYPAEFPNEAAFVREVFRRALNGDGVSAITRWINRMGFPTQTGHNKTWAARTVGCILRNPVYIGHSTFHGEITKLTKIDENGNTVEYRVHDALITDELYDSVQAILGGRKRGPKAKRTGYRLAGAIVCGRCGRKMVGKAAHGRGIRAYSCNTRIEDDTLCSGNQISADAVETVVYDIIKQTLANPIEYARLTTRPTDEQQSIIDAQRETIQARIRDLDTLIANTENSDAVFGMQERKRQVLAELAELNTREAKQQVGNKAVDEGLHHFDAIWANEGDRIACQLFVNGLFSKITIVPAAGVILNQHQLKKLGWPANLDRISIEFANKEGYNLGDRFRERAAAKG